MIGNFLSSGFKNFGRPGFNKLRDLLYLFFFEFSYTFLQIVVVRGFFKGLTIAGQGLIMHLPVIIDIS